MPRYIIERIFSMGAIKKINEVVNAHANNGYYLHTIDQFSDGSWLVVMEHEEGHRDNRRSLRTSDEDHRSSGGE